MKVTAEQAGWLVDRSERIVRGRIRHRDKRTGAMVPGDLPATKEGNAYAIEVDDLERIPGWKVHPGRLAELAMHDSRTSEQLLTRLQALETELRLVKNRLHLLEARNRPSDALSADSDGFGHLDVESPVPYPRRMPDPDYAAPYVPIGVPAGARRMKEVTDMHGISHATAKRSIQQGVVAAFTRPQPNRPGYVEYWFAPGQVGPALRVWRSRGIEMRDCPDCPHDHD